MPAAAPGGPPPTGPPPPPPRSEEQISGSQRRKDEAEARRLAKRAKKDAALAREIARRAGPVLASVLEMPSADSVAAAAEAAALSGEARRRGRASTLLSDPAEQPLAARDIVADTVLARADAVKLRAEEKKKKLVAMGLYTAPATVLGG